jgi:serine protease inhibitor
LGAKIINGDRPTLHINHTEIRAHGVPWDGKEQLFLQENYPVSTIVEVRQAKQNSIRKLSNNQAFKLLMKQCFIPMWDDNAKFQVIKTIRYISKNVTFYRIFSLPHESAVKLLDEILTNNKTTLLKEEQPDMYLKEGFILKNIVDEWIIMPKGNNIKNFEGAIVINEIAAFIWQKLEKPISREDLLQAVLDEYDIDEQTASSDLNELLDKLNGLEILVQE